MAVLPWYHPYILLSRLLRSLPPSLRSGFVRLVAGILNTVLRKTALNSLTLAFPTKSPFERRKIASKAANHMAASAVDVLRLDKLKLTLHDEALIRECYDPKHGLLIAGLHMGPPEAATLKLAELGYPVGVLIGAGKRSPRFNAFGCSILGWYNLPPLPRGNPLLLLKSLREGRCITFHCDMRSKDAETTFFGQPVRAPSSVINLALMQQRPLLFHYATPDKNDGWQLHFEKFELQTSDDRDADIQLNLQRLMDRMEAVIRQYPECWIWHYDRFRLKKIVRKT